MNERVSDSGFSRNRRVMRGVNQWYAFGYVVAGDLVFRIVSRDVSLLLKTVDDYLNHVDFKLGSCVNSDIKITKLKRGQNVVIYDRKEVGEAAE